MGTLKGGCLCGAVSYTVEDEFKYAGYCHCSQCRRVSGSAFSAVGGIAADKLQITRGADSITTYNKSADSVLSFCRVCGSSLFSSKPSLGLVHVRFGTLHDAPSMRPMVHVYVGSKAPWHDITDKLPQFEERAPLPTAARGQ